MCRVCCMCAAAHGRLPADALVSALTALFTAAFCNRRLTPHLASLSSSQLKLLTIYYNRSQSQAHAAAC